MKFVVFTYKTVHLLFGLQTSLVSPAGSGQVKLLSSKLQNVSLFSAGTSADGSGPVNDAPLFQSVVSAVKPLRAKAFKSPVSGVFVM